MFPCTAVNEELSSLLANAAAGTTTPMPPTYWSSDRHRCSVRGNSPGSIAIENPVPATPLIPSKAAFTGSVKTSRVAVGDGDHAGAHPRIVRVSVAPLVGVERALDSDPEAVREDRGERESGNRVSFERGERDGDRGERECGVDFHQRAEVVYRSAEYLAHGYGSEG